jgi:hypothetical protein
MNKDDKVFELKLKLLDLKLEKDKEIYSVMFTLVVGVGSLLFAGDLLKNLYGEAYANMIKSASQLNPWFGLFLIILTLVAFPLIMMFGTSVIIKGLFKIKEESYDKSIKEVKKLIDEYSMKRPRK